MYPRFRGAAPIRKVILGQDQIPEGLKTIAKNVAITRGFTHLENALSAVAGTLFQYICHLVPLQHRELNWPSSTFRANVLLGAEISSTI